MQVAECKTEPQSNTEVPITKITSTAENRATQEEKRVNEEEAQKKETTESKTELKTENKNACQ